MIQYFKIGCYKKLICFILSLKFWLNSLSLWKISVWYKYMHERFWRGALKVMFLQKKRFYILGRGFVSVGAAAPTDFEEDWFCTHWFWENLILYPHFLFTKVPFTSSFVSKYRVLHPQIWNPVEDPVLAIQPVMMSQSKDFFTK